MVHSSRAKQTVRVRRLQLPQRVCMSRTRTAGMGPGQRRFVYDYAYCVCLFGSRQEPVAEPGRFDFCKACGVEPWVYYSVDTPELYDAALARGAMLFTSNDPAWAMSYLRGKGLHG